MDARFKEIFILYEVLKEFDEYTHMLALIRSHIFFQRGDFNSAKVILEQLPKKLSFPKNRIYFAIMDMHKGVMRYSKKEFESGFKLGLLYHITGRFDESEQIWRAAGSFNGLIPYVCESLVFKGLRERRITPVKEAVKSMFELIHVQKKDKYERLAKQLDKFLLEYRFLAQ
jgi:hypothetical protein